MALTLITLRCLKDNYAYLLHGHAGTVLIDAPESGPILDYLHHQNWGLDAILLTHHHDDHIQGVAEIVAHTGAEIIGAAQDAHRLPPLNRAVHPEDWLDILDEPVHILDVSGHTIGHIAFHFPQSGMAFTGDSLMAMGCGRLLEGSPAMMWDSLMRLNALDADTLICSGHDYCGVNGRFAQKLEPDNPALQARLAALMQAQAPCAPASLHLERQSNPFLRPSALAPVLGLENADALTIFTVLRQMRNDF